MELLELRCDRCGRTALHLPPTPCSKARSAECTAPRGWRLRSVRGRTWRCHRMSHAMRWSDAESSSQLPRCECEIPDALPAICLNQKALFCASTFNQRAHWRGPLIRKSRMMRGSCLRSSQSEGDPLPTSMFPRRMAYILNMAEIPDITSETTMPRCKEDVPVMRW